MAIGRRVHGRSRIATWLVAAALASASLALPEPSPAANPAVAEADPAELKAYWQGRYRKLRMEEARLVETVKLATKEYADSNRRNYRRSGVRHFHRTNANEAKAQLAVVRTQLEGIFDEVVAAGGSVNWLYEVDDEPIDMDTVQGLGVYEDDGRFGGKGAYAPRTGDDFGDEATADIGDEADDDGRDPADSADGDADGDDPASFEESGQETYDYDAWRKNRPEYEDDRAPEKHLRPDDY